jgi:hypothetical protein
MTWQSPNSNRNRLPAEHWHTAQQAGNDSVFWGD